MRVLFIYEKNFMKKPPPPQLFLARLQECTKETSHFSSLYLVHYFRIGPNELMGCTAIGSSFIGIGRDHWLEMLDNPRKPVAQWYPLLETVPGQIPTTSSQVLPSSLSCLNGR